MFASSFEGSVLRSSVGHKACIKAATAPAVSFRASYRLPISDEPERRSFRRDSRVIGISPHQGMKYFGPKYSFCIVTNLNSF